MMVQQDMLDFIETFLHRDGIKYSKKKIVDIKHRGVFVNFKFMNLTERDVGRIYGLLKMIADNPTPLEYKNYQSFNFNLP